MPSKKKKYNARFPPARIKKIMQSDEEVGKVAQAVPVIISRALELFVESLLKKAETVTQGRNAKTLTPSHLKQCIMAEQRFDFLKDLVSTVPDVQGDEDLVETPTPRSASSSNPFVYPSTSAPVAVPSSSLGAEPNILNTTQPLHPGYYQEQDQLKSPSHPQQNHPGFILNPAGITSNPYIPSISGSASQMGGHFNYHLQHPANGMVHPSNTSGQVLYEDNHHHHHYQHQHH